MLGHPFQSSTVFGRRSAWAALCDCRDQGMYDVPEQVARWAFGNPASSRIFPEVYSKLVFIYKYIEIFYLTFPGFSRNIQQVGLEQGDVRYVV